MLAEGSTVAGYRIDRVLGRGGMGVVYAATQLSLERTVALKVMAAELSGDAEFSERFRREGRIQAALEHPHIITVYEAGESEDGLFIAMRLIRGPNLKDLIVGRELDASRALTILTQVADALDTAHAAGLVHRDIKPQNVLVSIGRRDHAYLADFGVTKDADRPGITRTGALVGTLDYMPPEQIEGHAATSLSDIYSFGAVLFESLTGVIPYAKNSDAAVLYAHLSEPPPKPTVERPELPAALDEVLAKAMAKKPEERYRTATEMMIDVDAAFGGRVAATAPAPGPIVRAEEAGIRRAEENVSTPARPRDDREPSPAAARAAPTTPAGGYDRPAPREQPRPARRVLAALAGALVLLAVAGFVGGRLSGGGGGGRSGVTTAAHLSLAPPAGWRAAVPPTIPGFHFGRDRIALAPKGKKGSALVAGELATSYPSFLPAAFLSRVAGNPTATRAVVELGSNQAYRYSRLTPNGVDGVVTVFAIPRGDKKAALIACYVADARAPELATCEATAASTRTSGNAPPRLVVPRSYAKAVNHALKALASRRTAALARLRSASSRAAQADAAGSAADAFRTLARSLKGTEAPAVAAPAQSDVLADAKATAGAYDRLRAAALRGKKAAYRNASSRIGRLEARLDAAVGALKAVVVEPR